jgi:hypothetical protein
MLGFVAIWGGFAGADDTGSAAYAATATAETSVALNIAALNNFILILLQSYFRHSNLHIETAL